MKDDLSLFDAAETPVVWRRQGEGTFFFIQSRVPDCYTIRCLCAQGRFANPGRETHMGGELVGAPGVSYEVWFDGEGEGVKQSPCYETVGLAKAAAGHHHLHGTWPPGEKE